MFRGFEKEDEEEDDDDDVVDEFVVVGGVAAGPNNNADSVCDAILPQTNKVATLMKKSVHKMNRCRCLNN